MKKYDILYLSQILLYSNAKSPYRMSSGKAAFLFYECCMNENSKRCNIKFVWCRTRGYVTANKRTNEIDIGEKIAHGGQPVLRWMMDNIFIKRDPARNNQAG